jgi:hypothetical protein
MHRVYTFWVNRVSTSWFTIYVVGILFISVLLGLTEASILISATNISKVHVGARNFAFNNCWLGIVALSDLHNLLTFIATLIISSKYHCVAK